MSQWFIQDGMNFNSLQMFRILDTKILFTHVSIFQDLFPINTSVAIWIVILCVVTSILVEPAISFFSMEVADSSETKPYTSTRYLIPEHHSLNFRQLWKPRTSISFTSWVYYISA